MTKLLVASGMGNLNSVEVVNLDESNPGLTCDNLQDLPYKLAGSTAQLFQGERPIICGGAEDSGINACDCFELQEGSWISIASLSTCRRLAPSANVSLQNGDDWFIIAGGSKYAFGDLASVEAFNGNIWSQGKVPSLPRNVGEHCMVMINETTLLSIGGVEFSYDYIGYTSYTNFYNSESNNWSEGPRLNFAQTGIACGILNWINHTQRKMKNCCCSWRL